MKPLNSQKKNSIDTEEISTMKDTMYLVFKQIGNFATRHDPIVAYIIGTGREAQEECNRRNKAGTAYHYFMEAAEVKKEGIEI